MINDVKKDIGDITTLVIRQKNDMEAIQVQVNQSLSELRKDTTELLTTVGGLEEKSENMVQVQAHLEKGMQANKNQLDLTEGLAQDITRLDGQVTSNQDKVAVLKEKLEELSETFESTVGHLEDSASEWRKRHVNYYPQGPQENVHLAQVLMGGWKQCFSQTYGQSMKDKFFQIRDELCTGSKIIMACSRQDTESSGVISLLAAAPREDAFRVTNTKYRGTNGTVSNGSKWYVYIGEDGDQLSWGFAQSGDQIDLASCDREPGSKRLCWHLSDHGWRCGEENSNYEKWEKIIFTRD